MKKLMSVVLVLTLTLIMAGCGKGTDTLTCTKKDDYSGATIKIVTAFENKKAISEKIIMEFKDKKTASAYYSLSTIGGYEYDIKLDGNNLTFTADKETVEEGYGKMTKAEIKKDNENEGYTCK